MNNSPSTNHVDIKCNRQHIFLQAVQIQHMQSPEKLNEEILAMFIYLMKTHHSLIDRYAEDCPYHMEDHAIDDMVFHIWGMFEAVLPNTNKRIVDEYAKTHIRDPTIASMINRIDNVHIDTFEILDVDYARGTLKMRGMRDGLTYDVAASIDYVNGIQLDKEQQFMICPWLRDGNRYSIMTAMCPFRYDKVSGEESIGCEGGVGGDASTGNTGIIREVENKFLSEAESIHLYPKSRLGPALRKYPAQWSRAICERLGINATLLSKKECTEAIVQMLTATESLRDILGGLGYLEQECASHIIKQDGFVKLEDLEEIFGKDDTEYWWDRHIQQSIIGTLRRMGLVIVGMRQVGQDTHKVAQITIDIMLRLKEMRSMGMLNLVGMQGESVHAPYPGGKPHAKSNENDNVEMPVSGRQRSNVSSDKPRRKKWRHIGSISKNRT